MTHSESDEQAELEEEDVDFLSLMANRAFFFEALDDLEEDEDDGFLSSMGKGVLFTGSLGLVRKASNAVGPFRPCTVLAGLEQELPLDRVHHVGKVLLQKRNSASMKGVLSIADLVEDVIRSGAGHCDFHLFLHRR